MAGVSGGSYSCEVFSPGRLYQATWLPQAYSRPQSFVACGLLCFLSHSYCSSKSCSTDFWILTCLRRYWDNAIWHFGTLVCSAQRRLIFLFITFTNLCLIASLGAIHHLSDMVIQQVRTDKSELSGLTCQHACHPWTNAKSIPNQRVCSCQLLTIDCRISYVFPSD